MFIATKMKLSESNERTSWTEIICQFKTPEKKWLEILSQHKKTMHYVVIVVYNDRDPLFSFQIIPPVSTVFREQPLQTPCSSPGLGLLWKGQAEGKALRARLYGGELPG